MENKTKCPACNGNSAHDENGYCDCCGNKGYITDDVQFSGSSTEAQTSGEWKK